MAISLLLFAALLRNLLTTEQSGSFVQNNFARDDGRANDLEMIHAAPGDLPKNGKKKMEKADSSLRSDSNQASAADLLCPNQQGGTATDLLPGAAHTITTPSSPTLAGDILRGADEIAAFLFGDRSDRRKVYNLVETGMLPHFRLGVSICARKSALLEWIKAQEMQQLPWRPKKWPLD
jgi:hypothetical protein